MDKSLITIQGVRGFIDESNTAQLHLGDVARGLGFTETNGGYVRWQRVEGYLNELGFSTSGEKLPEFVPENIFYRLAMKAKNEVAEKFQARVADEILPTIRNHGAYMTDRTIEKALNDPDFLIQLATQLKDEKKRRLIAESKVEEDKPKVLFADSVTAASTSILVGDLAKLIKQNGIDIGEIRLWKWLKDKGYAIKEKGHSYNMPTQKSMDLKVMEVKEGTRINSVGESKITKTTLITGKGQVYFVNKFLGAKEGLM